MCTLLASCFFPLSCSVVSRHISSTTTWNTCTTSPVCLRVTIFPPHMPIFFNASHRFGYCGVLGLSVVSCESSGTNLDFFSCIRTSLSSQHTLLERFYRPVLFHYSPAKYFRYVLSRVHLSYYYGWFPGGSVEVRQPINKSINRSIMCNYLLLLISLRSERRLCINRLGRIHIASVVGSSLTDVAPLLCVLFTTEQRSRFD